jgi:hypothetical protein
LALQREMAFVLAAAPALAAHEAVAIDDDPRIGEREVWIMRRAAHWNEALGRAVAGPEESWPPLLSPARTGRTWSPPRPPTARAICGRSRAAISRT